MTRTAARLAEKIMTGDYSRDPVEVEAEPTVEEPQTEAARIARAILTGQRPAQTKPDGLRSGASPNDVGNARPDYAAIARKILRGG